MVHRGRTGRLRLAGKLQQLQADLAGPVGHSNRSLADGLHRELAQLWPRRPKRVVQLAREHVVKEMMKVALCAAGHHGLARGLENVAISCFSGACRLVTAAERASGQVRLRTPRQAPTRDHFRGGPYATLRQRPQADIRERPTFPLKPTTRRPCNPSVCFIRRPTSTGEATATTKRWRWW